MASKKPEKQKKNKKKKSQKLKEVDNSQVKVDKSVDKKDKSAKDQTHSETDYQSIVDSIKAVMKIDKEKPVEFNQEVTSLLAKKLEERGDNEASELIAKVDVKTPKEKGGLKAFFSSKKFYYAMPVVLILVVSLVAIFYATSQEPTITALKDEPVIPLITMNPTDFTESGYMSTKSQLKVELGSPINGDISKNVVVSPNLDFEIVEVSADGKKSSFIIEFEKGLERDTIYEVSLAEGTQFENDAMITKPLTWVFSVDPAFALIGSSPRDGARGVPINSAVEFVFNHSNIDAEEFQKHFTITPNVPGTFEVQGNKIVLLPSEVLFSNSVYTATVSKEFTNGTDESLAQDQVIEFITGSQLDDNIEYSNLSWGYYTHFVESSTDSFVLSASIYSSEDVESTIDYQVYSIPIESTDQLVTLLSQSPDRIPDGSSLIKELTQPVDEYKVLYTPPGKGLYIVQASSESVSEPIYKYFIRSDIGVSSSSSTTNEYGFVYNLVGRTPLVGAELTVVVGEDVSTTINSNDEGYFEVEEVDFLIGRHGSEYFYHATQISNQSYWSSYNANDSVDGFDRIHMSVATDKPVYKYGDQVKISGILKGLKGEEILSITDKEVEIRVVDSSTFSAGYTTPFYIDRPKTDGEFGVFDGGFKIPENMDTSVLYVDYFVEDVFATRSWIRIENYSVPQEVVEVEIPQTKVFSGESVTAYVTGTDYNGGPLSGKEVSLDIRKDIIKENYPEVVDSQYCSYGELIESKKIKLDKNGQATFTFTPTMDKYESWNFASFTTIINAEGESSVTTKNDCVTVSTSKYDIDYELSETSYEVGDTAVIEFESFTLWDENELPSQEFEFSVNQVTYERVQTGTIYNPDTKTMEPVYTRQRDEKTVFVQDVVTDGSGKASVEIPNLEEGEYYANLYTADYGKRNSFLFSVSTPSDISLSAYGDYPVIETSDYNAEVGDTITVRMLAKNGISGLYTVQGVDLISSEAVASLDVIEREVVLTKEMYPNVSVCILNIQKDFFENIRTGLGWAVSCSTISFQSDQGIIDLEISTDKDVYTPGEEVTVDVVAKGSDGNGVEANLSTSVVNQAILDQYQYDRDKERGELRDSMYYDLKQSGYWATNMTISDYGGYGSGGDGGEQYKRDEFNDSGYWATYLRTNKDGKAQFKFTANDALTEWRIKIIASDKTDGTGVGYSRYSTYMDRYVNVIVPDFIRDGDSIMADLQVVNYLGATSGKLQISCPNCMEKEQEILVDIVEGGRQSYDLKLANESLSPLDIDVELELEGSVVDNVGKEVEVRPNGQLTSQVYTTVIDDESEDLRDVYEFQLTDNEAKYSSNFLNLSRNSGALFAGVPLKPSYKNTSSLASAISINAYVLANYDAIGPEVDRAEIEEVVYEQLAEMYQNQTSEGGFGDVSFDSPSLSASVGAAKAYYHARNTGLEIAEERVTALERYLMRATLDHNFQPEDRLFALSGLTKLRRDFTISQLPGAKLLYNSSEDMKNSPYATSSLATIMADVGNTGEAFYFVKKLHGMGLETSSQIHWTEPLSERISISDLELSALAYTAMAPLEEWSVKYKTRDWLMSNNSYENGEYVYYTTLYALSLGDLDSIIENDSSQALTIMVNGNELGDFDLVTSNPSQRIYLSNEMLKSGKNTVEVTRDGSGETYLEYDLQKILAPETDTHGQDLSYKYFDLSTNKEIQPDQISEGQYIKVQVMYTPLKDLRSVLFKDQWNSTFRPVNLWLNGTPSYVRDNFYTDRPKEDHVLTPDVINDTDITGSAYKVEKDMPLYFEYVIKVDFSGESLSGYLQIVEEGREDIPSVLKKTELTVK